MNNIYPSWWEDTITVYNKHTDADKKITWYRTVIKDCFWKYLYGSFISRQSVLQYNAMYASVNKVSCRIPKDKKFLPANEWKSKDNKSNYFTLFPGDIVVRGECVDEINEYESGSRSSDFVKRQKETGEAITIESVSINVGTDKCCEHYLVIGE